MDGAVILIIMLGWFVVNFPKENIQEAAQAAAPAPVVQLNPHLNPSMYHDEQAFMKIANELGFH